MRLVYLGNSLIIRSGGIGTFPGIRPRPPEVFAPSVVERLGVTIAHPGDTFVQPDPGIMRVMRPRPGRARGL